MSETSGGGQDPCRLCRVVTVPITFATLLRQQVVRVANSGFDVTLVSSPGPELAPFRNHPRIAVQPIALSRTPSPVSDLRAVARLFRLFRSRRFDIVHSSTPKAGLVCAVAAWLARVPVRLHTYTGQPWVELGGAIRWFARACDRLIGLLNTHCYADSASQRQFLIDEGLVRPDRISVLGHGSISGVDLSRFDRTVWGGERAEATRRQMGVPLDAPVILFVGRVTRDKGVCELVEAFQSPALRDTGAHLVVVGHFEPDRDPLPAEVIDQLTQDSRIHLVGFAEEPAQFVAVADLLCLPSYREGFGSVVIEAAAMGVPAVVTSIVGLADAVVVGETGLAVPPKQWRPLADALVTLLSDARQRAAMGAAAQARARRWFDSVAVDRAVIDAYWTHLGERHASHSPDPRVP